MTIKRTPKLRHHKASGQGFVELAGKRMYLGRFDLPETEAQYHRLIAEWKVGQQQTPTNNHEITIDELVARFWVHAKTYYRRPDGSRTDLPPRVVPVSMLVLGPVRLYPILYQIESEIRANSLGAR